ncbi:MAG: PAP/fibrillin family protein [Leptolyngbyaceae cyanobacterium bins.59]|nr:PAP/fibrillin family protein [Leptolyngbyaceae cyanobacterium bins.59]
MSPKVNDRPSPQHLKAELLQRLQELSLEQALFPNVDNGLSDLVIQLEQVNPTPFPLQVQFLPNLLGNWELIYASRGTVVTRNLDSLTQPFFSGIRLQRIWQTLTSKDDRTLTAENGATLELPWLGQWQLRARGQWRWETAEQTAHVSFNAFSVQACRVFGQPTWQLPEFSIPVLEPLRNEALWVTSYLDDELRIGRGATGNRFVFRR